MGVKCIVKGCPNHQGEGGFVGALCSPCHHMITTGLVGHGFTFIHVFADKLRTILETVKDLRKT